MTDFVCVACDQMCIWDKLKLTDMGILRPDGSIEDCLCPMSGRFTDFGLMDDTGAFDL